MQKFLAKPAAKITATLSCFDLVFFKGHLLLGYPEAIEPAFSGLGAHGLLIKDFKPFVLRRAERIKAHARAQRRPRPFFEGSHSIKAHARARL